MPVDEALSLPERRHRLFWWKEVLIVLVFYGVYSWIRNQFGSNSIRPGEVPYHAFANAERVIRFESLIGLYHEQAIQQVFLPYRLFIQFWNTWYGTVHFVVTVAVIVLLFRKRPAVYPVWRNSLAIMTAMAILGFALFPLMPPRLLDKPCDDYGGACIASDLRGEDGTFGFVDTLSVYGGPWSFDSDKMADLSNQYAAMPSMHIGWAMWCAVGVWPLLRRRWQRAAVFLYPLATLFCIIVTANHFWLDGLGGLFCFAVGTLAGWGLHRWNQNRLDRKHLASLGVVPEDQPSVATGNNPAA
jgi:PAP2 superfamily